MPDSCPICGKALHSIITRRIGEVAVCIDCGDKIIPLMNAIGNGIIKRCKSDFMNWPDEGIKPCIRAELDNFSDMMSDEDHRKVIACLS